MAVKKPVQATSPDKKAEVYSESSGEAPDLLRMTLPSSLTPSKVGDLFELFQSLKKQDQSVKDLVPKRIGLSHSSKAVMLRFVENGEFVLQHSLKREELRKQGKGNKLKPANLPLDGFKLEPKVEDRICRDARKQYMSQALLIINSLFEYGFLNKEKEDNQVAKLFSFFGQGDKERQEKQDELSQANPYLKTIHHFSDYLESHLGNLETVKYVITQFKDEKMSKTQKGIRWVLLALY
mmetsp:Transcript_31126/g.47571  ORF Transcript_31126/g.47571 Transcript_31126/m.47571 type:complete len:237 (+) Transcript_31126:1142-1852(+)